MNTGADAARPEMPRKIPRPIMKTTHSRPCKPGWLAPHSGMSSVPEYPNSTPVRTNRSPHASQPVLAGLRLRRYPRARTRRSRSVRTASIGSDPTGPRAGGRADREPLPGIAAVGRPSHAAPGRDGTGDHPSGIGLDHGQQRNASANHRGSQREALPRRGRVGCGFDRVRRHDRIRDHVTSLLRVIDQQ